MVRSNKQTLDFWFSIGSTYTYFSVMRTDVIAENAGVEVNWRPFNVRHTIAKMASNYRPFTGKPMKLAYMWRDMERRSKRYGLSPKLPAPYSLEDIAIPNRVALVGMREGWGVDYTKEAYRLWFELSEPADKEANLLKSLKFVGQEYDRVLKLANSDDLHAELEHVSEEAHQLGIFGAPSYVVDDEVFWGDDRLEDAIQWAKYKTLAPS